MQPADAKRFREVLRAMGRVLVCESGSELDNPMLDVYWLALRDWTLEDFEAACGQLLKTSKFMPRPADFTALRKAGEPTSGEVWAEVLELVRTGDYRRNEHANPRVNAAVRALGGYQVIAMSNSEYTHLLEKRFAEHFEAIGDREDIREAVPRIAGPSRLALPVGGLLKRLAGK